MKFKDNNEQRKNIQKLIYNCTAEAYRIATARLDDANGLKTIFKRRGNVSGTVEAANDALSDILIKEDIRKQSEVAIINLIKELEINAYNSKNIMRMSSRILEICDKIKLIKFPFNWIESQVQEIMNLNSPYQKVADCYDIIWDFDLVVEDILNQKDMSRIEVSASIQEELAKDENDKENEQPFQNNLDENEENIESDTKDHQKSPIKPSKNYNQDLLEAFDQGEYYEGNWEDDAEIKEEILIDLENSNIDLNYEDSNNPNEYNEDENDWIPPSNTDENAREQNQLNEIKKIEDIEIDQQTEAEVKIKIWHIMKLATFKTRHLFDLEVMKYQALLDHRKFFGLEEIQPIIVAGRRGLIQKRQQNIRSGNQSANRSLTANESDTDKYYK